MHLQLTMMLKMTRADGTLITLISIKNIIQLKEICKKNNIFFIDGFYQN